MNNDFVRNPLLNTNKTIEFTEIKDSNFKGKYYRIVGDFLNYKHDENDVIYLEKYMSATKTNIIIDLISTHYYELNNEIKNLFNLKDDIPFIGVETLLGLRPLTDKRRKSSICNTIAHMVNGKVEEEYNKLAKECSDQLGKLIDYTKRLNRSIDLCENEAVIKELLTQQGFIKNGLILAPEEVEVKI